MKHVMDTVVLPPRKPKGSKQNSKRALIMQAALHQAKVARQSVSWKLKHQCERCRLCKVKVQYSTS